MFFTVFWDWLFKFNIVFLRFIDIITCKHSSFIFNVVQYSIMLGNYHVLSLLISGYLIFSQFCVILNNAAVNIFVHVAQSTYGRVPKVLFFNSFDPTFIRKTFFHWNPVQIIFIHTRNNTTKLYLTLK